MRPVDCPQHRFDYWPFGDSLVCKRCRMVVSGEEAQASRRKQGNGVWEPISEAARRAAVIRIESGEEPQVMPETGAA